MPEHHGDSLTGTKRGPFRWDWVVVLVGAFGIGLVAGVLPRVASFAWCIGASYCLGRWDSDYGAKWRNHA